MSLLFKVKGGAELPVHELEDHDLKWYAESCRNPAKKAAAEAEVQLRRGGGQAIQPARKQAAIVKPPDQALIGTAIGDAVAVTKTLAEMSEKYHLVAPQTQVDSLPEGCGVSVSLVLINKDPRAKETYNVGGRLGLSKDALTRIAAAAGVDWDTVKSGRLDNGSDPRYCHYRAVGRVRQFDGTWRTISGEVEIDARDGSDLINEIRVKATSGKNKRADNGDSQILELRKFILRHAESKAKNRAIADMGVRRSYDQSELDKPFAVAKLTWTGRSDDPEVRREFAKATAANMLGGVEALYGGQPRQLAAAQADDDMPPDFQGHAPPPVGKAASPDAAGPYDVEAEGEDVPPSARGAVADGGDADRGDDPDKY